jgi:hypothetical protein
MQTISSWRALDDAMAATGEERQSGARAQFVARVFAGSGVRPTRIDRASHGEDFPRLDRHLPRNFRKFRGSRAARAPAEVVTGRAS